MIEVHYSVQGTPKAETFDDKMTADVFIRGLEEKDGFSFRNTTQRYVVGVDDLYYVDAESPAEAKEKVQENIGSDDYFVTEPTVIEVLDE